MKKAYINLQGIIFYSLDDLKDHYGARFSSAIYSEIFINQNGEIINK